MSLLSHLAPFSILLALCLATGSCALETDIPNSRWQSGNQTSSVIAMASSTGHSCALNAAGGVSCWGDGTSGQLGPTESVNASRPVRLPGAGVEVAVSTNSSCLVSSAGRLTCWGANAQNAARLPSAVASVALLRRGVCVLADGIRCAGSDPALARFANGGDLAGLPTNALAAAGDRICALSDQGAVSCWGADWVTPGRSSDAPEPVQTASAVSTLALASTHACALFDDGTVGCWGDNRFGQLGQPTGAPSPRPLRVPLSGVAEQVFVGPRRSCARTSDGVFCWGDNRDGLLGDGTTNTPSAPVRMTVAEDISSVSHGESHTCVVLRSGQVVCWGSDAFGQLGRDAEVWSAEPMPIAAFVPAAEIAVGRAHACIASRAGDAWCVGENRVGQLGDGTGTAAASPVRADSVGIVDRVSAREDETCVGEGAAEACWGDTLGSPAPLPPPPVDDIVQQDVESGFGCGRRQNGEVFCWGEPRYGRTGSPNGGAARVTLPGPASHIDVGGDAACATLVGGEVFCWGRWAQFAGAARRPASAVVGLP